MFIAMNRFKVRKGAERDFEQVWLSRETHLENVPGFLVFHLLKGPERDDHVLYASHSLWRLKSILPIGRGLRPSARPMKAPAPTSRSISGIRSLRASPFCRR